MREVDPFAYFFEHASAIPGFGGGRLSPDPQYCFHTHYADVRPGRAHYELRLLGVHSSQGELTVRVHAYRVEDDTNVSLVAAGRLDVTTEDPQDLSVAVRFMALPGVRYAFYGYFNGPADIAVGRVQVLLDEPEDGALTIVEPPRSALALDVQEDDVRPANALIHVGLLEMDCPVSQDCTKWQLSREGYKDTDEWCEELCLNALNAYGIRMSGLDAMLLGQVSNTLRQGLEDLDFITRHTMSLDARLDDLDFVDILLCPAGMDARLPLSGQWELMSSWLGRLKFGGFAVFALHYRVESEILDTAVLEHTDGVLTRNDIGQWTMRLIGSGYSVAPLGFGAIEDLVLDGDGLATCALIVRRM